MWDGLWKRDKESMLTQLKKECKMMTKNKELAKSYPGTLKILGWVTNLGLVGKSSLGKSHIKSESFCCSLR